MISVSKNFYIDKLDDILCRGYMLLMIITEKKLLENFIKMNCKKQIKKSLELKK